jgi:signal transduction histidine kinase/streptogramin lyase
MIRLRAKLFLFVCGALTLLFAFPTVQAKKLPIRMYTSADGLGSSFVNYVTRDSRGFMWFCTRDGLSRFDGARFVTYQITEHDSPPGIEQLYETRDGIYWITTTSGTYRFDPKRISTPDGGTPNLNAERVFGHRGEFFEDSRGNLWLGSNGLFQIDRSDGKADAVEVATGLPDNPDVGLIVTDLSESSDGSLWAHSSLGLVRLLPDGRKVVYLDKSNRGGAFKMLIEKNGRVWVSRANYLFVIKPESLDSLSTDPLITKPLSPSRIVDVVPATDVPMPKISGEIFQFRNSEFIGNRFGRWMFQTSDGDIWVSSEDYLLHLSDGVVNVHTSSEGLPSVMGKIAEDSVGNLWIAGQSSLARLDRNGFVSYGKEDGMNSERTLGITEGPDGVMYFATPGSHIASFDGSKFQSIRPGFDQTTNSLWTSRPALLDSRGDWWILTVDKLYRFSGALSLGALDGRKPTTVYGRENGLTSNGALQIFEDSLGDIWVSTRGNDPSLNGLSRLRVGGNSFESFTEKEGYPLGRSPATFAQDKTGNIWIAFVEGGVARFDGERFHVFTRDEGLPPNIILTDSHIDTKGRLWITSASAGVFRVDDPTAAQPVFVGLTTANGLTSNNVRTVTEDRFGRIYFGTARGVDRLSPKTGSVKSFSVADGLPADFVSDSHCARNGDLWFATNSGVAKLVPTQDVMSEPPSIWLGGLRVAGDLQPIAELGTAELQLSEMSSWQNSLQIDFYGIDFRVGEGLRYQYLLEGANGDWSAPDENRSVTFANLQPGSYRFLVRAVNSDDVSSKTPATLAFTILPPIWQRWWFILIAVLVVGLAIFTLYRYRMNRLQEINAALRDAMDAEENLRKLRDGRIAELEKVRARIATDLHDDIGASLTQIAILSEVAQAQSNGKNGNANEPLAKITDVSNELVGTMSDIVWSINPSKDHLSDLIQRMRRFAADVFSIKGVTFQFVAPGDGAEIVVTSNIRREVFLIFKETVNNVLKHSGASNVRIEIATEGRELIYRIADDGIGFDPENPSPSSGGHGINGMLDRVEGLGGKLHIISESGKGTTVLLTLPLVEAGGALSDDTTQTGGSGSLLTH